MEYSKCQTFQVFSTIVRSRCHMCTKGFATRKLVLDQSQFLTKRLFCTCILQSASIKSFQESVTDLNK